MVRCVGTIALLGLVLAPSAALAQIDLSGSWGARYHEDQPERIPGPELGDFLGLPINDSGAAVGAQLGRLATDAARAPVPGARRRPTSTAGRCNVRIWEEKDPKTQQLVAIKHYISTYEQTRTIWMDGRPHPPAYAPHTWMGFSTGTLGRRHAGRHDHAHQAGLASGATACRRATRRR